MSRLPLSPVDRKVVGDAAPYDADFTLRARESELVSSQRARREVAWDVVAKVLAPVPLSAELPNAGALTTEVPTWQTWYSAGDLQRVFHHLYEPMPTEDKAGRVDLSDAQLDESLLWNVNAVDGLPTWPADRYADYLDAIDEQAEVAGLGGLTRVAYSPSAARHLLASYGRLLDCRDDGVPPEQDVGPVVETPVARKGAGVVACGTTVVGTYALAADERLVAELEEVDGRGAVTMRLGDERCTDAQRCELEGPGEVEVLMSAGTTDMRATVVITRQSSRPAWSACLADAFPTDAVVVKADYRRADFEMPMPVYDTSAEAIAARMAGNRSWEQSDGEAQPGADEVYSLTLPDGTRYRLAALHVMTKELDHWLWTTLWWSQDSQTDFGADRPESVTGVWQNYKMCAVVAFDEGDPDPEGGFAGDHDSLAASLAAASTSASSWCSNPYLEEGHGNASTNCIGCHQHGGTRLPSEDILLLDDFGRPQVRNNFPTDYAWATTSGDNLTQMLADEELYFLGAP